MDHHSFGSAYRQMAQKRAVRPELELKITRKVPVKRVVGDSATRSASLMPSVLLVLRQCRRVNDEQTAAVAVAVKSP